MPAEKRNGLSVSARCQEWGEHPGLDFLLFLPKQPAAMLPLRDLCRRP